VDLAPLVVRVALAVIFVYHGYDMVFEGGHANIARLMAGRMGRDPAEFLPQALGWLAAVAEFFGGVFVGLGVLSRLWALGHVVVMAVAIATVHGRHGFALQGETGPGYEYNFALICMAAAILLGGPGRISLDRVIFRRKKPAPADKPGT
jgi:putative oxidoreductase